MCLGFSKFKTFKYFSIWLKTSNFTQIYKASFFILSGPLNKNCIAIHKCPLFFKEWINLSKGFNPGKWGWKFDSGRLAPCATNLTRTPESLLKITRCTCKTDCNSERCSCCRHGLSFAMSYKFCKDVTCSNCGVVEEDEEETPGSSVIDPSD